MFKKEENIRTAALVLFFLLIVVSTNNGVRRNPKLFGSKKNETKNLSAQKNSIAAGFLRKQESASQKTEQLNEAGVSGEKMFAAFGQTAQNGADKKLADEEAAKNALEKEEKNGAGVAKNKKDFLPELERQESGRQKLEVAAEAALIINSATGKIIYQKNITKRLLVASLAKFMSAAVISEFGDLGDDVSIEKSAIQSEGDAEKLTPGKKFQVKELLKIMLVESNNSAAAALGEYLKNLKGQDIVFLMNQKSKQIGMKDTNFENPIGFDGNNNFSTAYDMSILLSYISFVEPEILNMTKQKELVAEDVSGRKYLLRNTNVLLDKFPEINGGKTGYTYGAKECLMVEAEINGEKIIFVVLGSDDRFAEMEKMINWAKSEKSRI